MYFSPLLYFSPQALIFLSAVIGANGQGLTCETPKDCEVGECEIVRLELREVCQNNTTLAHLQTSTTRTAVSGVTAPGPLSSETQGRPSPRGPWRTGRGGSAGTTVTAHHGLRPAVPSDTAGGEFRSAILNNNLTKKYFV